MKMLKYQKAGAVEVIKATNHEMIGRETAVFLNREQIWTLYLTKRGSGRYV